jgi:hypothetical protein
MADFITVIKVVSVRVIKVYSELYEPQSKDPAVKIYVAPRVGCYGGYVMNAENLLVCHHQACATSSSIVGLGYTLIGQSKFRCIPTFFQQRKALLNQKKEKTNLLNLGIPDGQEVCAILEMICVTCC